MAFKVLKKKNLHLTLNQSITPIWEAGLRVPCTKYLHPLQNHSPDASLSSWPGVYIHVKYQEDTTESRSHR